MDRGGSRIRVSRRLYAVSDRCEALLPAWY